jgi:methylmalonyl-CoA mutase
LTIVALHPTDAKPPFAKPSEAEWRRRVETALGGRPVESLISTTFEGLKIEPLYPRAAEERARPLREAPGPWKIAQRMDHPDPEAANAMARCDLKGGADALTFAVAPAITARGFGVEIAGTRDLNAALAGIELDLIRLRLDAGANVLELAPHFAALAEARRLTAAALDVDFGHDPIGESARSGSAPSDRAGQLRETHRLLRDSGFAGHLLLADGRPYHDAGSGEAQELACVIATAVEYLRLLEKEGLLLGEAQGEIAFLLAADADEFLSLAKIRALRLLWQCIESSCGLNPKPIRLHAEASFRMMTRYDPWVNIMRVAMGTFAAGAGGADTITAMPFTLALGLPDEFARRIARNTQLILIHEAKLADVADPAAGAGSFEALTEALCSRAWALFQKIEAHGGMAAALRAGLPQSEILAAARARREAIARRERLITGTSVFPLLAEAPVNVLAPCPIAAHENWPGQDCLALRPHRDAEPFEMLRSSADAHLGKTGERPKIFLAGLGEPQTKKRAADRAADFFAIAGIEALRSEARALGPELTSAFSASGCKIACICAAAEVSPGPLIEMAGALKAAGAARIFVAGSEPNEAAIALLSDGAAAHISPHCNALEILQNAIAAALPQQQG